jgi:hypothetical protein
MKHHTAVEIREHWAGSVGPVAFLPSAFFARVFVIAVVEVPRKDAIRRRSAIQPPRRSIPAIMTKLNVILKTRPETRNERA